MSKVNRRKEIQEKEALQLKFQLAISQTNKHVLNWLPNARAAEGSQDTEDKEKFMDLPVIANGQGLNMVDDDANGIKATVGDFLRTESIQAKPDASAGQDPRSGSKAMTALMNRMRTDKRTALKKESPVAGGAKGAHGVKKTYGKSEIMAAIKKPIKKPPAPVAAEESDDEESKMKQISGKKHIAPKSGKKSKARPF